MLGLKLVKGAPVLDKGYKLLWKKKMKTTSLDMDNKYLFCIDENRYTDDLVVQRGRALTATIAMDSLRNNRCFEHGVM